jgi:2-dehydro-3-deoxyphosphogluconate aldolase / (4S)-4-hydroxy-2-oxoglutarate aldolase
MSDRATLPDQEQPLPTRARHPLFERLVESGVVVVVRLPSSEGLDRVAQAAIRAGAGALEVTTNTPGALGWLRQARTRFGDQLLLGMGTVVDTTQAAQAFEAGARFYVAPTLDVDVVASARTAGVLAIPGAFTPTEILAAWRAGADLVKVFPASVGGPRYLADVLAPLDGIPLFPTGNVDASNAADFIHAGAAALAIGASAVNAQLVADGRFDEMSDRIRRVVDIVREARRELRTRVRW